MEAIKKFDLIAFGQEATDLEPNHAATLSFTRNAFDPMGFTLMWCSAVANIEFKYDKCI